MDNQDKTKEELIKELQLLQQAHNFLKATMEAELLSRKLTEDELRASEERFQLLFNKAPLGYQSLDFDGNFIEVNQQWLDTLGYTREEVIGKWFGDFLTPVFKDGFRKRFPIFKAQGKIHSEFEMLHKNGSVLFIAFEGRIGYDLKGEFKQTHCILQDITERKQIEEKLIRSEKELKKVEQITHIGSWYLDVATNEVEWSEELYKMYGFDPALPVPPYTEHQKLFTSESWELLSKSLAHTANTGIPYELELKTVKDDGSNGWMWVRGETVTDNDGKTIGLWGAAQDITERKHAEIALAKSEENLAITLNSIGDGVIATDRNGLIVNMNPVAETLCGWKLTDGLGKPLHEVFKIINAETGQSIGDPVEKVLENGEIVGLANHTVLISKDGTEYQISDSAAPIKNKEGAITGVVLVFSNVSEKYAAELALKESEERYKALHNASFGGIVIHDKGKIIECNQGLSEITGYSYDELIGMDGLMPIAPKTRELVLNNILAGYEKPYETLGIRKNGELFPLRLEARNVPYKGRTVRTVEFRDITEQKQAEEALRESEKKMRSIYNIAPAGIGVVVNRVLKEVNPLVCEMTGYTREELIEKNARILYPSQEEYDFVGKEKYRQITEKGTGRVETLWHKKDGTIVNIILSSTPIDINDISKGTIFTALDITERKQVESELQKIEWLLKPKDIPQESFEPVYGDITSLNSDGVILKALGKANLTNIVNDFMNLLETSSAVYEKNGDYAMGIFSSGWCQFMDKASFENCKTNDVKIALRSGKWLCHDSCWNAASQKAIDTGSPVDIECSGGINLYAVPIRTNNEIIGAINFGYGNPPQDSEKIKELALKYQVEEDELIQLSREYKTRPQYIIDLAKNRLQGAAELIGLIVQRNKAEQELIIAKEKAEESDRLKSAFLANMSHEIRTPMNGILGFAGLLKEPNLTGEEQQEYIHIIQKSGKRMLNIINDIVDISKIEAGLMKLNIVETNINEQIEYIYTFFKPEVEEKGMKLSFINSLPSKEAILKTDREKVYAILTNLVKNAIKYSEEGTIEIGYKKRDINLEFYVKDTGLGIPKERHEAIFERFIQADIADKWVQQGAGLGLSITKAYVEMLGGKIWVESREGIGSTFYFTLPYNEAQKKETVVQQFAHAYKTDQVRKLKILIAEDDKVSEMLIDITVKMFAKEIIKVRTGVEAVEACKKNPDIDLVMMDIRMPKMDGFEATRQIRHFNKEVVIIAQTAFALSGDREKAIEAGCNDYIAKPINKAVLLLLIQKYFRK